MPELPPIETKIFIRFLLQQGYSQKGKTIGSHASFSKPGVLRPIIIVITSKEMPGAYVRKYLKVMGITVEDFLDWLKGGK